MTKHDKIYIRVAKKTDFYIGVSRLDIGECFLEERQNVIVMTQDELLDIMQEAMEHTIPAQLLRTSAEALVKSRITS